MILFDSGQFFWGWDVSVTGLDVDGAALEKARRGLYHQGSLRAVTPALFERHFTKDAGGVRVKESARRSVAFRAGNLLDPASYERLQPLDAVFCRNVLIYFSDGAVQRAVSLFHQMLAPGGYLFLGHAESLARVSSGFVPIRFQGAIVYQKTRGGRGVSEPDPRAGGGRLRVRAQGGRAHARRPPTTSRWSALRATARRAWRSRTS